MKTLITIVFLLGSTAAGVIAADAKAGQTAYDKACKSCHGAVDHMPLMYMENSLQMEWCLDCHRNPEKNIRPKAVQVEAKLSEDKKTVLDPGVEKPDNIFSMDYEPPSENTPVVVKLGNGYRVFTDQDEMGKLLVKEYHLRTQADLTSCSTCHR